MKSSTECSSHKFAHLTPRSRSRANPLPYGRGSQDADTRPGYQAVFMKSSTECSSHKFTHLTPQSRSRANPLPYGRGSEDADTGPDLRLDIRPYL